MNLDALIDFYQTLTPASVSRFGDFYAEDAYFKDPFNEVRGLKPICRIFEHMFTQVSEPRFVVTERMGDNGGAFLIWEFHFRIPVWGCGKPTVMRGVSHLRFDADGRVAFHRDYWDTAEELYMKLPALGPLMQGVRWALSAR